MTGLMSRIACPPLPADTAKAATSVFGREHAYIRAGDALNALWAELNFTKLEAGDTLLAGTFYPFSLATIFQYWEHLTDRQMAQATRTRMDLKYALHLPLSHPGVAPSALCAFRQHVLSTRTGREALQSLMDRMKVFTNGEKSASDVMQMIPAVCEPSRAELILERMGMALEAVATCNPDWLKANAPAHWYRRYHLKLDNQEIPSTSEDVERLMLEVGGDGWNLIHAIEETRALRLAQLPEISSLRHEWNRQFLQTGSSLELRPLCALCCESNLGTFRSTTITGKEDTT
jgi:transposase